MRDCGVAGLLPGAVGAGIVAQPSGTARTGGRGRRAEGAEGRAARPLRGRGDARDAARKLRGQAAALRHRGRERAQAGPGRGGGRRDAGRHEGATLFTLYVVCCSYYVIAISEYC